MPECQTCGHHVSQGWARVFGVDGEVQSCPSCGNAVGHSPPPVGGSRPGTPGGER